MRGKLLVEQSPFQQMEGPMIGKLTDIIWGLKVGARQGGDIFGLLVRQASTDSAWSMVHSTSHQTERMRRSA
jgi:hypothetical protein